MAHSPDAREAVAKAIYFAQYCIMHDHEECWSKAKASNPRLWNDIADAALSAMPASDAERVREMAGGRACEKITENRHVKGLYFEIPGLPQGVMRITEIVRGSFLHIEDPSKLTFASSDPMREVYERGMAYEDKCATVTDAIAAIERGEYQPLPPLGDSARAAPAKTEAEAIEAALVAYRKQTLENGDMTEAMRLAIVAADLARFGGDPGERIKALEAECFKLAADQCDCGYADEWGNRRCDHQDTIERQATLLERERRESAARIAELEAALKPFSDAAENVPEDRQDFQIVAHVPGGHNAAAFERMSRLLTAGSFRTARTALRPKGSEG